MLKIEEIEFFDSDEPVTTIKGHVSRQVGSDYAKKMFMCYSKKKTRAIFPVGVRQADKGEIGLIVGTYVSTNKYSGVATNKIIMINREGEKIGTTGSCAMFSDFEPKDEWREIYKDYFFMETIPLIATVTYIPKTMQHYIDGYPDISSRSAHNCWLKLKPINKDITFSHSLQEEMFCGIQHLDVKLGNAYTFHLPLWKVKKHNLI